MCGKIMSSKICCTNSCESQGNPSPLQSSKAPSGENRIKLSSLSQTRVSDSSKVVLIGVGTAYQAVLKILNTRTCEYLPEGT